MNCSVERLVDSLVYISGSGVRLVLGSQSYETQSADTTNKIKTRVPGSSQVLLKWRGGGVSPPCLRFGSFDQC